MADEFEFSDITPAESSEPVVAPVVEDGFTFEDVVEPAPLITADPSSAAAIIDEAYSNNPIDAASRMAGAVANAEETARYDHTALSVKNPDPIMTMSYEEIYSRALEDDEVGEFLSAAIDGHKYNGEYIQGYIVDAIKHKAESYKATASEYDQDGDVVVPEMYKKMSLHDSKGKAFARNMFQSVTLGFSDEIMAYGQSIISDDDYSDLKARYNDKIQNFKTTDPGLAMTAEIGGFIVSSVLGGAVLNSAKLAVGGAKAAKAAVGGVNGIEAVGLGAVGAEKAALVAQGVKSGLSVSGGLSLTAGTAGRTAATGAIENTIYGVGTREGVDKLDVSDAFGDALIGAIGGFAGHKVLSAGGKVAKAAAVGTGNVVGRTGLALFNSAFRSADDKIVAKASPTEISALADLLKRNGVSLNDLEIAMANDMASEKPARLLDLMLSKIPEGEHDKFRLDIETLTMKNEGMIETLMSSTRAIGEDMAKEATELAGRAADGDVRAFEDAYGRVLGEGGLKQMKQDVKVLTQNLSRAEANEILRLTELGDGGIETAGVVKDAIEKLRISKDAIGKTLGDLESKTLDDTDAIAVFDKLRLSRIDPETNVVSKPTVPLDKIEKSINDGIQHRVAGTGKWEIMISPEVGSKPFWGLKNIPLAKDQRAVAARLFNGDPSSAKWTFSQSQISDLKKMAKGGDNDAVELLETIRQTKRLSSVTGSADEVLESVVENDPPKMSWGMLRGAQGDLAENLQQGRVQSYKDFANANAEAVSTAIRETSTEIDSTVKAYARGSDQVAFVDNFGAMLKTAGADEIFKQMDRIDPEVVTLATKNYLLGLADNPNRLFDIGQSELESLHKLSRSELPLEDFMKSYDDILKNVGEVGNKASQIVKMIDGNPDSVLAERAQKAATTLYGKGAAGGADAVRKFEAIFSEYDDHLETLKFLTDDVSEVLGAAGPDAQKAVTSVNESIDKLKKGFKEQITLEVQRQALLPLQAGAGEGISSSGSSGLRNLLESKAARTKFVEMFGEGAEDTLELLRRSDKVSKATAELRKVRNKAGERGVLERFANVGIGALPYLGLGNPKYAMMRFVANGVGQNASKLSRELSGLSTKQRARVVKMLTEPSQADLVAMERFLNANAEGIKEDSVGEILKFASRRVFATLPARQYTAQEDTSVE